MEKIIPHLWYDNEAKEAAQFYVNLFEGSKILNLTVIEDTPSGNADLVSFELAGQEFKAISGGPLFKFNPSISLMISCSSVDEVNTKWKALSEGGEVLMPLGEYPFNKLYGWLQDRYGLSWQLLLLENIENIQKIKPSLLFSNEACGRAEEAVKYYTEIFKDSEMGIISRYNEGETKASKAEVNYSEFRISGSDFSAMDNGVDVDFGFNEAFSFMIYCKDQEEIDYFWSKLSAVPEAEQCGWVKDKFGVSWQIVPTIMKDIMESGNKEKMKRVTEEILKMKKLDLEVLEKAYNGV